MSGFLGVQRQNYCSDFKFSLYVVTYHKVTQLSRESFRLSFNQITSIKSFDFSTLYTTIPHQKLKSRLATIIRNSFIHKKWESQIQISGFRSRRTLFCQGTLRFEKQVHWRWHRYHARVSSRQHFRGLWGKGFPTDSRHSDGHKLCPSPSRHISVLLRSGIHTVFALNWKEKISISVQLHIPIHRWRIVNQ